MMNMKASSQIILLSSGAWLNSPSQQRCKSKPKEVLGKLFSDGYDGNVINRFIKLTIDFFITSFNDLEI